MAESNNGMTIIGADTHIKGEMTFEKSARIVGAFEGRISAKGLLEIADGARCKAEVQAESVDVDGEVEGNLSAGQKVTLNAKARVRGDIVAGTLIVSEGASIVGHVSVGPDAEKASSGRSRSASSSRSSDDAEPVSAGPQSQRKAASE